MDSREKLIFAGVGGGLVDSGQPLPASAFDEIGWYPGTGTYQCPNGAERGHERRVWVLSHSCEYRPACAVCGSWLSLVQWETAALHPVTGKRLRGGAADDSDASGLPAWSDGYSKDRLAVAQQDGTFTAGRGASREEARRLWEAAKEVEREQAEKEERKARRLAKPRERWRPWSPWRTERRRQQ
jgi:hypothetical protein